MKTRASNQFIVRMPNVPSYMICGADVAGWGICSIERYVVATEKLDEVLNPAWKDDVFDITVELLDGNGNVVDTIVEKACKWESSHFDRLTWNSDEPLKISYHWEVTGGTFINGVEIPDRH
jgi:hypothetical protein